MFESRQAYYMLIPKTLSSAVIHDNKGYNFSYLTYADKFLQPPYQIVISYWPPNSTKNQEDRILTETYSNQHLNDVTKINMSKII